MTCTEALDLLPAAVDGQIGEELLSKLRLHFSGCPSCLHEFELEQMTKRVVRKYSRSAQSPSHLLHRVKNEVNRERDALGQAQNPRRRPSLSSMLVLGGVGAIILLFAMIIPTGSHHHTHTQPVDGNIIHQTYNNFDSVLSGDIHPEIVTDDPAKVKAFFLPTTDFNVQLPPMRRFKLVGAMCSKYDGKCVAQVIYRGSKDIVYLYQVKLNTVLHGGSGFQVSPEALAQLKRTGWYFENHAPDCSLVMWVVDSTLCCAVADINKDVLFASLTESR